jgi:hypothetical protein
MYYFPGKIKLPDMKRPLFLLLVSTVCCFYFTVSTTSCTKSNSGTTIMDTTVIKDTLIMKDTVTINAGPFPITGLWVGTYFITGDAVDSFMYQLEILSDSTIYTVGSGTNQTAGYASGPWHLSGTTFTATLTTMADTQPENVQTITATYDSVTGRLYNGTWIDTRGNGGQTGTFSVRRVQ